MLRRAPFLSCALLLVATVSSASGQTRGPARLTFGPTAESANIQGRAQTAPAGTQPRQKPHDGDRAERIHEMEGDALIRLADAAASGKHVSSDLAISWRNEFLKAQQGTFVPFVVTVDSRLLTTPSVLLYVRLASRVERPDTPRRRGQPEPTPSREPPATAFPVEEVYPVEIGPADLGKPARIMRGFSAPPGEYDLIVIVRERVDVDRPALPRRTGVLSQRLVLPDFTSSELSTSSVILADRLRVLESVPADEQPTERPYLIGLSDIQPATDNRFGRGEELIVVFLVYNPFVTPERKFDIEVEYHFFTKTGGPGGGGMPAPEAVPPPARDGERYFNHTRPQRFTPATMGPRFDPSAGQPLMAGQGVPLAAFPVGEYRLEIRITDIVTGKSILKDVSFSVVP